MHKHFFNVSLSLIIALGLVLTANAQQSDSSIEAKTAIFAGGCFWCIEADFEKLDGVIEVVSGYTGGAAETANYKTVTSENTGHYEAVEVSYDPSKVSYVELVDYFWLQIDPTDSLGQFCDKGESYKSAIFYASEEEQKIVEQSIAALNNSKPFSADIVTTITATQAFYLAEDYHQDYYKKNPIRYNLYRRGCGRDARIAEVWDK